MWPNAWRKPTDALNYAGDQERPLDEIRPEGGKHFMTEKSRTVLFVLVAVGVAGGWLQGGEESHATQRLELKTLTVMRDESASVELFESIVRNLRESLPMNIRVGSPLRLTPQSSPEDWVKAAAPARSDGLFVLAVVGGTTNFPRPAYLSQSEHVAILNLAWVLSAPVQGENRPLRISRLAQTEAMHALGTFFDLRSCFNPRCAMSTYDLNSGVPDLRGRNYCPPCQFKVEKFLGVDTGMPRLRPKASPGEAVPKTDEKSPGAFQAPAGSP